MVATPAYPPPALAPATPPRVRVWPLGWLLAGYPVLWLTGFAFLALPAAAVLLAWELYRRRRLRVPAGFGFYVLLLLVVLLSATMLGEHAPGTLPNDTGIGRYLAWGVRFSNYAAAGIILLFVGNLTEQELPTARVVRWLSALFVTTAIGGLAGLVLPPIQIPTPARYLLPGALTSNGFVRQLVTVTFAQWQTVLGHASPRPSAPFVYTNTWGNMLSLLLPYFVVGAVLWARRRRWRNAALGLLALTAIPVIFSLNRGLWVGLLAASGYVLFRLARRGDPRPVVAGLVIASVAGIVIAATPLSDVVLGRMENQHSNVRRTSIAMASVDAARHSPFIGYGGQLTMPGSERSIAVGPTPRCPKCGNREVGGEGQLFLLLVSTGFVGAACYIAFFLRFWWRYRGDPSPIGVAGGIVALLTLVYLPFYASVGMPLAVTMVGLGLWWRHAEGAASTPTTDPA